MTGSLDERVNDKGAISRYFSDTSANASGSILYLYKRINVLRSKIIFLCNTLWVGENRKIESGRLQLNVASLSIHGSVKYSVKSHQTLTTTGAGCFRIALVLFRNPVLGNFSSSWSYYSSPAAAHFLISAHLSQVWSYQSKTT